MKLRSEDPDLTEAGVGLARLRLKVKEKRVKERRRNESNERIRCAVCTRALRR